VDAPPPAGDVLAGPALSPRVLDDPGAVPADPVVCSALGVGLVSGAVPLV